MEDKLRTLLFESSACRAQLIRLNKSWQKIHAHNPYPPAVSQLLGELVAASALLSASLKFDGALVLQIHGDGPIQLLVAECNSHLGLRATVKLRSAAAIDEDMQYQDLLNRNGQGRFALILDPANRQPGQQPYQGIVSLEGASVADSLEAYMRNSEQLETRMRLFSNGEVASGLLLQQMPRDGGMAVENFDPDGWNRLSALTNTLHAEEALGTDLDTLSHRLFWEEKPLILAERDCEFQCTCSRKKVEKMLFSLGKTEVDEALKEQENVHVHCDFCNSSYIFTKPQCEKLFARDEDLDPIDPDLDHALEDPIKDLSRDGTPPTLH